MNLSSKNPEINFWLDAVRPMLAQEFRKWKASAGHAITTTLATAVVMALFGYIFGDFFKQKLPEISQEIATKALSHLATTTLLVTSLAVSHHVASKVRDPENWLALLSFWGFSQNLITNFRRVIAAFINLIALMVMAFILNHFFAPLLWWQWILAPVLTIVAVARFDLSKTVSIKDKDTIPRSGQNLSQPPLVAWRNSRIANSSWNGSSLRIIAALPIILGTTAILMEQRIEVSYLSSLLGGILLSWTVPFLIEDDLQTTWIERQAAVSHQDWIASWQKIFNRWSARMFLVTFIGYTVCMIAGRLLRHEEPLIITTMLAAILTNSFLAAFPTWLAPAFVMQIDGNKPVTNIIMLTLIGIFAGSVIMAAPIAAPVLVLLHREAHRYQGGRFARGSYN